jgi:branched-chain amino acid transport system ATP-binding protein
MNAVLSCEALDAGYNGNAVVRDFNLTLGAGEVVALLGPNGAGKTTVLLTLAGLIPRIGGSIAIGGKAVTKTSASAASSQGLVLVPDDRALFTTLTVRENLIVGKKRKSGVTVDTALGLFPELGKRLNLAAGMLSGGEQQMLAIARAMMQQPKVLLIDELSMGLAPVIVQSLLPIVRRVADDTGAGVVLVEQHVHLALDITDRALVLVHGRTALTGRSDDLASNPAQLETAYLGSS